MQAEVTLLALSCDIILCLYSNDTYLWKNIMTILHHKNKYPDDGRENVRLPSVF